MAFPRPPITLLCALVIVTYLALAMRSAGMYPSVFWDEYLYSRFARFGELQAAPVPSYLYFLTYSFTGLCGDGFMGCARLANVAFFTISLTLIFVTSRRFVSEWTALAIALITALSATNTYTAYFMPESFYFFAFWLIAYLVLDLTEESDRWRWIFTGAVVGLASLIKVHAIFLLPAITLYLAYTSQNIILALQRCAVLIVVALVTKMAMGYLIVGAAGLRLLGSIYGGIAAKSGLDLYAALAASAAYNLFGHILGLSLLFAVPIGQVLLTLARSFQGDRRSASVQVALFSFAVLSMLLVVVPAFTASSSFLGPTETNVRLHMRYYTFAFPLLILACGIPLKQNSASPIWGRAAIGAVLAAVVIYVAFTRLAPYNPIYVDCPELFGIMFSGPYFYLAVSFVLISLLIWIANEYWGARGFLFVVAPFLMLLGSYYHAIFSNRFFEPSLADRAGVIARQYLSDYEISDLAVFGHEEQTTDQVVTYFRSPGAAQIVLPRDGKPDLLKLAEGKGLALVIGSDNNAINLGDILISGDGFVLSRLVKP